MCDRVLFRRRCWAGGGDAADAAATLNFAAEPGDVVVARGAGARLDCAVVETPTPADAADAAPPTDPFRVTWFHDGRPVVVADPRRDVLANGSLYFVKVRQSGGRDPPTGVVTHRLGLATHRLRLFLPTAWGRDPPVQRAAGVVTHRLGPQSSGVQ